MSGVIRYVANELALQRLIGDLRESYRQHGYLRVQVKAGRPRSLDQNALVHAWYDQISRELREDSALGVKCYCKLHFGVPILRAEDADYRETYDTAIRPMPYPRKLVAMRQWPVTSLMTRDQLTQYADAIAEHYAGRGVHLSTEAA